MLNKDNYFNAGLDLSGIKIALVVSNEDPKGQERLLVRVLGVHNLENESKDNAIWAYHCAPTRNASGDLPEAGDFVYVLFPSRSDCMTIIWLGFVRGSVQGEDLEEGTSDTIKPNTKKLTYGNQRED